MLLGEPGSGKSTAFLREAEGADDCHFVTARNLIAVGPPDGWAGGTLFIDALDEGQVSSGSFLAAFDAIRKKLVELGRPRFRLSCREAEWFSEGASELKFVSPNNEVVELYLEPLSDAKVRQLVESWVPSRLPEADEFLAKSEQLGVAPLFGNPLLLDLVVRAVGSDRWPASKEETYELACRQLALEHNLVHQRGQRGKNFSLEGTLHQAGLLSALLVISSASSIAIDEALPGESSVSVPTVAAALGLNIDEIHATLSTPLFGAAGFNRVPRHRTVAEYLGAKAIARLVQREGLPISRVLALICGNDGRVVDAMRGLYAWLCLHCKTERLLLIERDPLGLVLYGDVRPFSASEKVALLDALHREAAQYRWFRNENWSAQPFGALGTSDMVQVFADRLGDASRDPAHQAVLDCILDAIQYGSPMSALTPALMDIVRDTTYWPRIRKAALDALLVNDDSEGNAAKHLLREIDSGQVEDDEDELIGALLTHLYPTLLPPNQVVAYLRKPKLDSLFGDFKYFWKSKFLNATPGSALPALAEHFASSIKNLEAAADGQRDDDLEDMREIAAQLLARALLECGDDSTPEQIYSWLRVTVDEYGFHRGHGGSVDDIRAWLSARPSLIKAILAFGYSQVHPDEQGKLSFWIPEHRLGRVDLPKDWYKWMLSLASITPSAELAQYCFRQAAMYAISPPTPFDITIDDIAEWVSANSARWPNAQQWQSDACSWALDTHYKTEFARKLEATQKRLEQREERQRSLAPHLEDVYAGKAPPSLSHQLVLAYQNRFSNINGKSPVERLQDYLVIDETSAQRAIGGIRRILTRYDLPTADEISSLDIDEKRHFYLQKPCLLAAELESQSDPNAWQRWDHGLIRTLVAFVLVASTEKSPTWYLAVANALPELVAPLVLRHAAARLGDVEGPQLSALRDLREPTGPVNLARVLLPELFSLLPDHASPGQVRFLNTVLLPAAGIHDTKTLLGVASANVGNDGIDERQRLAYLVAGLRAFPDVFGPQLDELFLSSSVDVAALTDAIIQQYGTADESRRFTPRVLARLVEILAPSAAVNHFEIDRIHTHEHERGDISPSTDEMARRRRFSAGGNRAPAPKGTTVVRKLACPSGWLLLRPAALCSNGFFQADRRARSREYPGQSCTRKPARFGSANGRPVDHLCRAHPSRRYEPTAAVLDERPQWR
ncbi:NACHT domain-containing NTPase [Cupriavidus sp. 2MCAB6]